MCTEQFETKKSGRALQVEGFCALRIGYISHKIGFYIIYKSLSSQLRQLNEPGRFIKVSPT